MLAEMAMFIQLLGMAVLAAILPTIIVMCAIYLIYTYRAQLLDILQGILRIICWVIICLVDGKAKADGIKVRKAVNGK
ncbi:hypothetical protein FKV75_02330 [Weissella paramesenteroides]|uniref:hypothetical protein n=1 Tax=Weissella paramesenteroides TaxID=1249 RepID=UPI00123C2A7E|nr:hypothetical protein [Weissella paramesenteroides]KAA8439129.1 hypothetical protein FKV81_08585 [Weissella paramesenteroides]KAA8440163.1 hypothetical protein FKV77_08870 [Weissella paramesenteroides]KAA8443926.1 hypothetical protein FKV75_02330 [Weissella paramesenteroides]KAA8446407.1 hypothetical protein FKV76_05940 [Weissella paramesenteroides]KAA8451477.1 hypothetical protein FKV74_02330 [Weissella paramesenteroides]